MLRYVLYINSESEIWKNIGDQVDIRVVGFLKYQGCMQWHKWRAYAWVSLGAKPSLHPNNTQIG